MRCAVVQAAREGAVDRDDIEAWDCREKSTEELISLIVSRKVAVLDSDFLFTYI